ncbi:hypothetical protein C8F01DRAFT_1087387 [Mycena amicta]|nr:hypothetical protein C8F01DRAFT_1087387 [Mycena amicta]
MRREPASNSEIGGARRLEGAMGKRNVALASFETVLHEFRGNKIKFLNTGPDSAIRRSKLVYMAANVENKRAGCKRDLQSGLLGVQNGDERQSENVQGSRNSSNTSGVRASEDVHREVDVAPEVFGIVMSGKWRRNGRKAPWATETWRSRCLGSSEACQPINTRCMVAVFNQHSVVENRIRFVHFVVGAATVNFRMPQSVWTSSTIGEEDQGFVEDFFAIPDEVVESKLHLQSPWLLRLELNRNKIVGKLTMHHLIIRCRVLGGGDKDDEGSESIEVEGEGDGAKMGESDTGFKIPASMGWSEGQRVVPHDLLRLRPKERRMGDVRRVASSRSPSKIHPAPACKPCLKRWFQPLSASMTDPDGTTCSRSTAPHSRNSSPTGQSPNLAAQIIFRGVCASIDATVGARSSDGSSHTGFPSVIASSWLGRRKCEFCARRHYEHFDLRRSGGIADLNRKASFFLSKDDERPMNGR